jgi:hypothetical protein
MLVLSLWPFALAAAEAEEEWDYVLQFRNSKETRKGSIVLHEAADGPWLEYRFAHNDLGDCTRGKVPVTVARAAESVTLEIPAKGNCPAVRFLIRSDGNGGTREILRDGAWVPDGQARGLTARSYVAGPGAAKLRFVRLNTEGWLDAVDTRSCPHPARRRLVKPAAMFEGRKEAIRELEIDSREKFRFMAGYSSTSVSNSGVSSASCTWAGEFQPQPGGEYEATFDGNRRSCSVEVSRVGKAGPRAPEPSLRGYGQAPEKPALVGTIRRWEASDFCALR